MVSHIYAIRYVSIGAVGYLPGVSRVHRNAQFTWVICGSTDSAGVFQSSHHTLDLYMGPFINSVTRDKGGGVNFEKKSSVYAACAAWQLRVRTSEVRVQVCGVRV